MRTLFPRLPLMCAHQTKKNDGSRAKGSMLGLLKPRKDDSPKMVTVREQKKTLVRVVKAKPKSVKHRAETLKKKAISEHEMKITEEVVKRVTDSPKAQSAKASPRQPRIRTFECPECGARIPEQSEMCPVCHIKYLKDICPEAVTELDQAMSDVGHGLSDLIEIHDVDSLPVLHFDTFDGIMNFLEDDSADAEFVLECPHCSAVVQFDLDRCPICNTEIESNDVGILSLLRGTDFDTSDMSELECPHCGEHVSLEDGVCPECSSQILDPEGSGDDKKLIPVIGNDNVVFIHMDLEKGDLNFIQKHLGKITPDHVSIQLDKISSSDFDHEWKGLSRI